jgi:SAM-dependent methyltransferase
MANDEMRELWADSAVGWVEHRDLFEAELEGFADVLVETVPPTPGGRILDIGCGTGGVTARYVAGGSAAVGVDISAAMIDAARASVPDAEFLLGDAQTEDLAAHGPFTGVVSRFGVMFFDDPVAAFTNIRRAMAPDAQLGFICWRGIEENQMFTLGTRLLQSRMDPPAPPPTPGAPGPLALAEPGRAVALLQDAGWGDVAAEPVDVLCDYGIDGSDGVEERLVMVLNTSGGRAARAQLEAKLGPEGWADLLDEVRAELRRNLVDGRVAFTGAAWLLTAHAPS